MKVRTDKTLDPPLNWISIHGDEPEPTGVLEGSIPVTEGDFLLNESTGDIKIFDGTQWNIWKSGSGE